MANPVRVMMVLTVRFGKNGITNCVMNYVSRFDPARIRCDLVCPNEPDEEAKRLVRQTGGDVFILGGRNRNPIAYVRALGRLVLQRGEQVVHAHGNSATLQAEMLAAKRGGALVSIPHSHNTTCKMKVADRLLRGAFYRTYSHAIACSKAAGEWLFPGRPYRVLNNAIDSELFRFDPGARRKLRERFGITAEDFVFMHIGAFNRQKNQAFLLEAFRLLLSKREHARLLLAGDGERKDACAALAHTLGIGNRVDFLGLRDDVPALLSAADAFVLPSLHEGLPLTLVEAQCAGLPCLSSDFVTSESALTPLVSFAPIERAEAFADAMNGIAAVARAEASDEAIRLIQQAGFDVSGNAEALMRIYEETAGCMQPDKSGRTQTIH
jgi:glycosyltransferase involved in cell wall biosynthesis